MSVVSKNPFDLLGEDGEVAPAPKAKAPAPAAAAPAAAKPAAARGGKPNYPSRGGARNTLKGDREATDPESGFQGERVASSRGSDRGRGGRGRGQRGHTGAGAVAHGGFDRKSQGRPDSHKKEVQGWGAETGAAELQDEVLGESDANKEAAAPASGAATPKEEKPLDPEAEERAAKKAAWEEEKRKEEEEQASYKSYEEYLKEKASAAIEGVTTLAKRVIGDWEGGGEVVKKDDSDDVLFAAKEKERKVKEKKAKEAKTFIEIEPVFRPVGGAERGERGDRRGGRGGARGGAEGGRGRGNGRGRGAPRGAPRGGRGAASSGPVVNLADATAFPSLS